MFFRGSLVASLLFVLGCGSENAPPSKNVDVNFKSEADTCLLEVGERISAYMNSELNNDQIKDVWSCLNHSINDFVEITSPEHPRGYPPEALARFFEDFFLKREIPLEVAEALMNVKRIFIGGEKEFLTVAELSTLKGFLGKAEEWSLELNPHLKILFLSEPEQVGSEELAESLKVLKKVSFDMGAWIRAQNQVYSQQEVRELLVSLQSWLALEPRLKVLDLFIESLPTFFDLKKILIGGTTTEIRPIEWVSFLDKTVAVVSLVQTINLKFKTDSLAQISMDRSIEYVFGDLADLFFKVSVPFSEIEVLIENASELSWWPAGVPASGLSNALEFFFHRFLELEKQNDELIVDHRAQEKLLALKASFKSYLDGSNVQFEQFLAQMGPASSNSLGLIDFVKTDRFSDARRNQLAVIYTVVHQAFKIFETNAFSKEGFENAFKEVLQILHDLNLLRSVSLDYGSRLFLEANVFTLVSNGNEELSKPEVSFYAWMALSAFAGMEHFKDAPDEEVYLTNFPLLKEHLSGKDEPAKKEFYEIAQRASGSDSRLMKLMVFSYLECFMMRFDQDQNSRLNLEEVLDSYQTFGPTLKLLLGGIVSESDTLAFFTYLFKYGTTPMSDGQYGGFLRFIHWKLHPEKWELDSDRTRLAQILAELAQLL